MPLHELHACVRWLTRHPDVAQAEGIGEVCSSRSQVGAGRRCRLPASCLLLSVLASTMSSCPPPRARAHALADRAPGRVAGPRCTGQVDG